MPTEILEIIKQANLVGRGGSEFPVYKKWLRVDEAPGTNKIVVCNAAEGEPGIRKDIHIMQHHLDWVFAGMKAALDFLKTKNAYFFVKEKSKNKIKSQLDELLTQYNTHGYNIKVFIAPPKYIAGERNTLMSAIEGKILQPTVRQPSASVNGINGQPTLVQNVETFYNVAQAKYGQYQNKRFATLNRFDINGVSTDLGVYEVNNHDSIKQILEKTNAWPDFPFFVQVGGSASGVVLNAKQTETEILSGSGGIDIIPAETKPRDMLLRWFKFYSTESCGKCAPCFKGSARLYKIVTENEEIPWEEILKLSYLAKKASFCGLGESIAIPVESLIQNIVFPDLKIEKDKLIKKESLNTNPPSSTPTATLPITPTAAPVIQTPVASPTPTATTTTTVQIPATTSPARTATISTGTATLTPDTLKDSTTVIGAAPFSSTNSPPPNANLISTDSSNVKPKIKVGLFTFTCSEDSTIMITVLMNDYLLEWKKRIEFVEAKVLRKHKPDVPLDVAFVEGAITSEDQVPKLKAIRQRAKKLVAIGSCACSATPAGLRNKFDQKTKQDIDCVLKRFRYADKVRKLDEIVTVDAMIPGCPMNTKMFLKLLNKVFVEHGFEPIEIVSETLPALAPTSASIPAASAPTQASESAGSDPAPTAPPTSDPAGAGSDPAPPPITPTTPTKII